MKKTGFILTLLMLFQFGNAQDTLRITLNEAIEIAMNESQTIKVANMEIERVDYSKKSAWNELIPRVDASGQYSKFLVPAKMSMMGQVMDSPTDFNANLGLSISLPIFAPALWHNIQMSGIEMQSAAEKARASKINLKNEVSKAYYGLLVAQDSYQVLKDGYALAQENYEIAKRGYEVGAIAAYDYISAEVQLNNLKPTILQTESGIEQAKTYLKILMGLDVDVPIAASNKLSDFELMVKKQNQVNEYNFNNNSDLKQLDIARKQLQRGLKLQTSQRMPTLAAFSQLGYTGMGNKETLLNFGAMPIPVEASKDWYSQGAIVGLQLSVPITSIFTNTTKERQIKIQDKELELQREQLQNSIHLQTATSIDKMNNAVKQMESAKESVELSKKAYEISSKRYENGAGTMIELQNASLAVTQAQLSYHQSLYDYLNAAADVDKFTGKDF